MPPVRRDTERVGPTMLEVDLHGYLPSTIEDRDLVKAIVRQAWEIGSPRLRLIHGYGWWRHGRRPLPNTNTGPLGLTIRRALRNAKRLRTWMYARIDVTDPGATTVRLKANPAPSRTRFEALPDLDFPEEPIARAKRTSDF